MASEDTGLAKRNEELLLEYQLDFAKAALKMALAGSEGEFAEGLSEATLTLLQSYGKPIDEDLIALVVVFGQETADFARLYGATEATTKLKSQRDERELHAGPPAPPEAPTR